MRPSLDSQVQLRLFAVELAPDLLAALPEPFAVPDAACEEDAAAAEPLEALDDDETQDETAATPGSVCADDDTPRPDRRAATKPGAGRGRRAAPVPTQPWGVVLMRLLVQRCSDKATGVRAKALAGIAAVASSRAMAPDARVLLARLLGGGGLLVEGAATSSGRRTGGGRLGAATPASGLHRAAGGPIGATPEETPAGVMSGVEGEPRTDAREAGAWTAGSALTPAGASPLFGTELAKDLAALMRGRVVDEKGAVRKAAVVALEAAAALTGALADEDIAALGGACGDVLLSTRKAALVALSRLQAALPERTALAREWLRSALPLAGDNEGGVAEKAAEAFEELLLDDGGRRQPALLQALGASAAAAAAVAVAAAASARRGKLSAAAVVAMQRRLEDSGCGAAEAAGLWALLAVLTEHLPKAASWQFLAAQWDAAAQGGAGDCAALLQCVANAAAVFPPARAAALASQLAQRLAEFQLAPAAVTAHVSALARLAPASEGAEAWAAPLLQSATVALLAARGDGFTDASVPSMLFTVGQLALHSPASVPTELVETLQELTGAAASEAGAAAPEAGAAAPSLPIVAHAWAALAKLCLGDERLAKRSLPAFVTALGSARSAAVRNNCLVALADLCVRYTALVDAHVLRISACLKDPAQLVRRQALALLASLLQRDYIKFRGQLFLRFCGALADEAAPVRALAATLLADGQLAPRLPLLAYNHFCEALFALNACTARGAPEAAAYAAESEKSLFALPGADADSRQQRMALYSQLLRWMSPVHRLTTAIKLCEEARAQR